FIFDIDISSNGQFALSSSWDHTLCLWDLNTGQTTCTFQMGRHYSVDLFSPNHYWLHATTASCIEIFDLESKYFKIISSPASLMLISTHREPSVLVAWSADGQTLFGGLTDNLVCIQTVTS
ncbi:hypothetical protein DFJ58DRAFT_657354, partial [Suillus subalutaceus]|uniref:uncharacterized protein n=1 Tax=Suillus subalutaceus TaxID=48586 RepID=UPI001B86EC97